MKRLEILSESLDQTKSLGRKLAQRLSARKLILLEGDLGGGKTAFTKGLAEGLGVKREVISPTFTILQIYDGKKVRLYHFDFYRLEATDIVTDELLESLEDPEGVIVIEWAKKLETVLPPDRLVINFEYIGENSRKLIFESDSPEYEKLIGSLA